MAPKLEVIKGGGGSIRVGTTGTIGSLMTRELDAKCTLQTPVTPRQIPSSVSVSVPFGANGPKNLQPRTLNEASCSGSSSSNRHANYEQPGSVQKTRRNTRKSTHHMPILTSDAAAVETPNKEKANKKVLNFVEIVDIKCRNPNKWSSPMPNRFKKLSSAKFSETIS